MLYSVGLSSILDNAYNIFIDPGVKGAELIGANLPKAVAQGIFPPAGVVMDLPQTGSAVGYVAAQTGEYIGQQVSSALSNFGAQINPFGNSQGSAAASNPNTWIGWAILIGGTILALKVFKTV